MKFTVQHRWTDGTYVREDGTTDGRLVYEVFEYVRVVFNVPSVGPLKIEV